MVNSEYKLVLSDEARLDIFGAFLWYEEKREGLGFDFELCLDAALNRIIRQPYLFQVRYGQFGFTLLNAFLTESIFWLKKIPFGCLVFITPVKIP